MSSTLELASRAPRRVSAARRIGRGLLAAVVTWCVANTVPAFGEEHPAPKRSVRDYEARQTFSGAAYFKDNNLWGYNQQFAQLFGMPKVGLEDISGAVAAAFRLEPAPFQECGLGGRADVCRPVQFCFLDLYFDEAATKLPWSTDQQSQWLPEFSSMRWLTPRERQQKPRGLLALDAPLGVLLNETVAEQVAPFADEKSHRSAIFITDAMVDEQSASKLSGSLPLIGYRRDLYKGISVVELQMGCSPIVRKSVDIWLDAKTHVADDPVARFLHVRLPETYVARINASLREQFQRDTAFFRNLLSPGRANPPAH